MISRLKLLLLIVEGHLYLALIAAIFLSASVFLVWDLARRPLWQSSRFWSGSPLL